MKLGLLGAIGGLGKGLQTAGAALFDNELTKQREQRLQAIRDKEYLRNRQDQVADRDQARAYQVSDRDQARAYQVSDRDSDRDFTSSQSELDRQSRGGLVADVVTDSEGNMKAISADGSVRDLGIAGQNPELGQLVDVYQALSRQLTSAGADKGDPVYKEDYESLNRYRGRIESYLSDSTGPIDTGPSDADLANLPRRTGIDGKKYVEFNGQYYPVN